MTDPIQVKCPACGKQIQWYDDGMPVQATHYTGFITQQAVITPSGEEIEDPSMPPYHKCGHCGAELHSSDFQHAIDIPE